MVRHKGAILVRLQMMVDMDSVPTKAMKNGDAKTKLPFGSRVATADNAIMTAITATANLVEVNILTARFMVTGCFNDCTVAFERDCYVIRCVLEGDIGPLYELYRDRRVAWRILCVTIHVAFVVSDSHELP